MRAIKVAIIGLLAPLIGLAVAVLASASALTFENAATVTFAWGDCAAGLAIDQNWSCPGPVEFGWLGLASIATFTATLVLLVANRIVASVLGLHRTVLAFGFSPYAVFSLMVALVLGLANLAILAGAAYLSAKHWSSETPTIALALLGIAALGLLWTMTSQCLVLFRAPKTFAAARPISLYEHPRLGLLIREVAKKTGGRVPDNVILGLEPTFYATNASVQTPYMKGSLKGQTLHLSLPLMNLLSASELKAVIGHELGHFSGGDTQYSMRFAPAFASLHGAMSKIEERKWTISGILTMPTRLLLQHVVGTFEAANARISRQRELRADKLGASAATPNDVAFSLLKASVGGSVWRGTMDTMIGRAQLGRFSRNLVKNFVGQLRFDVDRQKLPPAIQFAMGDAQPHPTDSHPSTEKRIADLGANFDELLDDEKVLAKFFKETPSVSILDNLSHIEEDLTTLYYHIYASEWRPMAPAERDGEEIFLTLIRDFMARMVTIDGKVDDREIVEAEQTASRLFGNFDCAGFREACLHPEDLPELDRMIELAGLLLTDVGIANLKAALRKVAEADSEVLEAERQLLERIESQLIATGSD